MITLLIAILLISCAWGLLKFTLKITWGLIKFMGFLFLILAGPAFLGILLLVGLSTALFIPCLMFGLGIPMFRHGAVLI
jgi:hypothetical protein